MVKFIKSKTHNNCYVVRRRTDDLLLGTIFKSGDGWHLQNDKTTLYKTRTDLGNKLYARVLLGTEFTVSFNNEIFPEVAKNLDLTLRQAMDVVSPVINYDDLVDNKSHIFASSSNIWRVRPSLNETITTMIMDDTSDAIAGGYAGLACNVFHVPVPIDMPYKILEHEPQVSGARLLFNINYENFLKAEYAAKPRKR